MTTDADGHPFDPTNRAWQRLTALLPDHFDAMTWHREHDGRPVLLTLTDLDCGDVVTLAVLDSLQRREPHLLLAVTDTRQVRAYGPFDGPTAAAVYAPALAMRAPDVAMTRAVPLADPDQPLPFTAWVDGPDDLSDTPTAAPADGGGPDAVLLIDTVTRRLAAAGPFPDHAHAHDWALARAFGGVTTLVAGLQPAPAEP